MKKNKYKCGWINILFKRMEQTKHDVIHDEEEGKEYDGLFL
jgi:hypothetical protein